MSSVTEPNATAPNGDAGALYSALPSFFVSPDPSGDAEGDDALQAAPGFDPLVLPVQATEQHPTAHWRVASDGRLVSSWSNDELDA